MASRKEQKEQARLARIEAERVAAAKAARARRLRIVLGSVVAVVAVIAVGVAIAVGGGSGAGTGKTTAAATPNGVKLPAQKIANLSAATRSAGCVLVDTPPATADSTANRTHVDASTKPSYKTNPPSYGPHYPAPASDGVYAPKDTPSEGYLVHALEHGRIEYQYGPGLPTSDLDQLLALYNEGDGSYAPQQYLLLFQNPTHMPFAVAATAWGHVIGCRAWSPAVIDALRDFRLAYSFKAPETAYTGRE